MRKIIFLICILLSSQAIAQKVRLSLGDDEIALNEQFDITVHVDGESVDRNITFPEIPGFQKAGTSSKMQSTIVNGKRSVTSSLTQSYRPQKEGTFTLKPFFIEANGDRIRSEGTTINVGPAKQRQSQRRRSPFDQRSRQQEEHHFEDVPDDAFLSVRPSKQKVYSGEGVYVAINFFAKPQDFHFLQFKNDTWQQVLESLQQLKLDNTWVEEFDFQQQVQPEKTTVNGEEYYKIKLGELMIFPLGEEDLKIPQIKLEAVKYKKSNRTDMFGRTLKGDAEEKTFYSRPSTVKVIPLPDHPLKNKVAVGRFKLKENISDDEVDVNKSFKHSFTIHGTGNIRGISAPDLQVGKGLNYYEPNTEEHVKKDKQQVFGAKNYTYSVVPEKTGTFDLGEYISWVYFDPQRAVYDTLRSEKQVNITGTPLDTSSLVDSSREPGYEASLEQQLQASVSQREFMTLLVNIAIVAMFATTIGVYIKKRNG